MYDLPDDSRAINSASLSDLVKSPQNLNGKQPELRSIGDMLEKEMTVNRDLILNIEGGIAQIALFPPEECTSEKSAAPQINDFQSFLEKHLNELRSNNRRMDRILTHLKTII
jgi:hypothetical protein